VDGNQADQQLVLLCCHYWEKRENCLDIYQRVLFLGALFAWHLYSSQLVPVSFPIFPRSQSALTHSGFFLQQKKTWLTGWR